MAKSQNTGSNSVSAKLHRRSAIVASLASIGILAGRPSFAEDAVTKQDSASKTAKNDEVRTVRVRNVVELTGEVKLRPAKNTNKAAPKTTVESKSTLDYEEQFRIDGNGTDRPSTIRHFNEATAETIINQQATNIALRPECREIYSTILDGSPLTNCIQAPLLNSERDLVQGVLSSMYVDRILPTAPVKIGQSWELNADDIKSLFQLDSIQDSKITIRLAEADEKKAQLELSGQISGAARGVPTSIALSGKAQVDREVAMVTWLALSIEEDRELSNFEPGFKITARVRILRAPLDSLTGGQTLAQAEKALPDTGSLQIADFRSIEGGFRFLADRSWNIMSENQLETVLRYVKNNRVIAQCNITNLVDSEPGKQITLEGYQADIRQALGKSFEQFLESSESVTASGLRMIRIVSSGESEQLPVQWINIHLSNDDGRHVSLVFSLAADQVETFGASDTQIAGAFEFQEIPKEAPKPTEQAPAAEQPAQVSEASSATNRK